MDEKNKTIDISIIVPIYNEEKGIPELYSRLRAAALQISERYELIFINDGSADNSLTALINLTHENTHVKYIDLSRNFGHQIAVSAGIDHCKGKAVVIIDGDLQDPPELIPEMYAKYKTGYQVVYAKRASRAGESIFKKATAKAFYRIMHSMTSIKMPVDVGDFRLMDRVVVDALKQMPERNKFLRGQIAWLGFKQTEVLFKRDERVHGETGYTLSKMIRFAIDGITAFSDLPLLMVSRLGFLISGFSFLIIIYALFAHFVLDQTITGWTSLIISTMFIGGIQLLSIGVIGIYLSRINNNVLERPLYIIGNSNLDI